ncbi:MAG: AAA family ATPase [Chloroflexi bacterium]|nr:AAA family ATPase [Chloroflexota bacterium]
MPYVGPHVSPLLVGRDDLLALGRRRIAEVAAGRGHMLLLAGEPGVGKSRLLRVILEQAGAAGFRLGKGDLNPHDQLAMLAVVEDLARWLDEKSFGTLGPRLLAVDRAQGQDSLGSRRSIVRDVVDLILTAVDRPTLLAFEDLQWADEITLEVIAELARGSRDLPLLLVGVYRLDALPMGSIHREWRSRLLTQRLAEEARIQRLTRDETALVTTLLLGTGLPAPREVAEAVYRRTNGIPLHIEELLAAVDGKATDGRAILGVHVPDTIEDAILANVARLSQEARVVARAGAVLGRCFVPNVLAGILDRPIADLDEPLEELVNAGILYPYAYVDEGMYDFRHQLLRDALYGDVPARDLRRFHARAAEFGATLAGATEIHASVHFERAGLHDQAFTAALTAATAATEVYSHREAFDLYRRAIENMPDALPDREKARLWLAFSHSASSLDRNDVSRDAALRARELAVRAADGPLAVEALANLSVVARRECEPVAERRDLVHRLMIELDAQPDGPITHSLRGFGLWSLAILEVDARHLDKARRLFNEARTYAVANGVVAVAQDVELSIAAIDVLEGRSEDALATMRSMADQARGEGAEAIAVGAYRDAAVYAARALDYRQAGIRLAEGLKYADEIQESFCGHVMASTEALVSWATGRWDEAASQGGQALSDPGSQRARAIANWALGYLAAGRGDRPLAESHLRPALEIGRRAGWLEYTLPALWGLAEAALMADDPASAIAVCEEALTEARQGGEWGLLAQFVVTGVRAYQVAGRPDGAAKWLDQVVRAIGPLAEVASPAIKQGTGLVKLAEGSIVAARESLDAAAREWDERGRRWEALWARLDLATADLRANRYVEAMALVREVRQAATALGSRPLLVRADQLERLAKGRGAEIEPWHPLTVREFEVARKIAEGLTNARIGEELFVSPKTVSAHVEHILAKLGVARRTEVATWVATVGRVHAQMAGEPHRERVAER